MTKKTYAIKVMAQPKYVPEQSDPDHQKFIWSYEISIENLTDGIVQLLSRYWRVTDMTGRIDEVRGAGVIGLQPIIKPGRRFIYTSFCQLAMPQGVMEGHYEMQTLEEDHFNIEIPKIILSAPTSITQGYRSRLH